MNGLQTPALLSLFSSLQLVHCFMLHYTFRGALTCFEKYGLNRRSNTQAADVYRASMTFYTIRVLLNIMDVFADVNALTALLMTFVYGAIRARSRCVLVRCCCDVRDSMAMYLGGSVVLTILSCLCRKVEIFVLTMTPYDPIECCGIKGLLYLRGRLDNPEYSANAVSRYVGFSTIDCLMSGFKGVLMMRLFEYYDDLCLVMDIKALIYKRQQEAIARAAMKTGPSPGTRKHLSTAA
ncbi:uncharacterized protein LOC119170361 [Rhipicephalus microplus]|uniref:uncharacterized protein LOC119170361 n=1 Tax=Rhipicephalus microplus TaxID=6941 RepID=UPI003F6D5EC0